MKEKHFGIEIVGEENLGLLFDVAQDIPQNLDSTINSNDEAAKEKFRLQQEDARVILKGLSSMLGPNYEGIEKVQELFTQYCPDIPFDETFQQIDKSSAPLSVFRQH